MGKSGGRWRFFRTLSARLLLLVVAFVVLADLLVFVPSIARFRADFLVERLRQAQIAVLVQLASDTGVSPALERELLANAQVYNVVLRRSNVRQLVLSSPVPAPVHDSYDLRFDGPWQLIRDALHRLFEPENQIVRVIGNPVQEGGQLIEITMQTEPLRNAMLVHAGRIALLSALMSAVMAILLFALAQRLVVAPIRRVIRHMSAFAEAPEDARNIIEPSARVEELRHAEEVLADMQRQLTGALRQKERLAQLGSAVAKISHDLRNILTAAQLFADRIEASVDPAVVRAAPKLLSSINRAINLCERTLAFGRAEEPPPQLTRFLLRPLVIEVAEAERVIIGSAPDRMPAGETGAHEAATTRPPSAPPERAPVPAPITGLIDIPANLMIRADHEQLFRVLSNLARNARQAIEATRKPGVIEIAAGESEAEWWIRVGDTGPGLPKRAREHLFAAFQGGVRKGGTGLGLAISAELVQGHGGRIELVRSDDTGSEFLIHLPRTTVAGIEGAL